MIMRIVRSVIVAVMRMKLNVFGNQKAENHQLMIAHSTAMISREENMTMMMMTMTRICENGIKQVNPTDLFSHRVCWCGWDYDGFALVGCRRHDWYYLVFGKLIMAFSPPPPR